MSLIEMVLLSSHNLSIDVKEGKQLKEYAFYFNFLTIFVIKGRVFLVLFQPRKIRPFITERLLMGRKESNQTNNYFNPI